jgi:hypothetical protein
MTVSTPVKIIRLEKGKYFGEVLNSDVPLPRFKPCGMYVQGPKAEKTGDNLSFKVYKHVRG